MNDKIKYIAGATLGVFVLWGVVAFSGGSLRQVAWTNTSPNDQLAQIVNFPPEDTGYPTGHLTVTSDAYRDGWNWRKGHHLDISTSWGPPPPPDDTSDHTLDMSREYRANHYDVRSAGWEPYGHSLGISNNNWPVNHSGGISIGWPADHAGYYSIRDWPADHSGQISKGNPNPAPGDPKEGWQENNHQSYTSKYWKPDHLFSLSKTWGDHLLSKSATWPSGHLVGTTKEWDAKGHDYYWSGLGFPLGHKTEASNASTNNIQIQNRNLNSIDNFSRTGQPTNTDFAEFLFSASKFFPLEHLFGPSSKALLNVILPVKAPAPVVKKSHSSSSGSGGGGGSGSVAPSEHSPETESVGF